MAVCFIILLLIDWRNPPGGAQITFPPDYSVAAAKLQRIPLSDSVNEISDMVIDNVIKFRDTSQTIKLKNRGEEDSTAKTLFVFNRPVSFTSDTFRRTMGSLYFRSDVSFSDSRFHNGLNARDASTITMKPYNFILLNHSIFEGRCDILFNTFGTPFELLFCIFKKPVDFLTRDTLSNKLYIGGNFFGAGLHFNNLDKYARLSREAQENLKRNQFIKSQQIKGTITIRDCEFHGKLDLSECVTSGDGKLEFDNNILPDTLDLSKFKGASLDLRGFHADSVNPRTCYLNLLGNRIGNLNMEYHNYHLYFPSGTTDDQMRSTYLWLMKSVKENGYDSSYQELDMEYRHALAIWHPVDSNAKAFLFLRKNISKTAARNLWSLAENLRPAHLWDRIQMLWWGYGYEKTKVLYWSVLIILLFSIYNIFRYEQLLNVFNIDNLNPAHLSETTNGSTRKALRIWYCTIYTTFVFFKVSFDLKTMNFKSKYVVTLLIQYVVGLICSAFIVNLILGK